ncbi:hypothetical protein QBC38DRAFT_26630 [Podospora fimiseda]|uniref:Uncharacterized protein n=1 Tax=Podospora fimiseda TaxID=252190 RepID=A0AAN7BIW2_9PEZI|nr:hypothetical protein QBC38DRAFT_26630 [Podospora fimiseda]
MSIIPVKLRWVSVLIFFVLFPTTAQSSESSVSIYELLERIQDDRKALHETRAPSWVDAPNMRGTSSILYSCLLTLVACVYTALHLNIPEHSSFPRILLTKAKWVVMALFSPEIVLWVAVDQFFQARNLARDLRSKLGTVSGECTKIGLFRRIWRKITFKEVDKLHEDSEADDVVDGPDVTDNVFDLKYGFFVVMGGLEVNTVEVRWELSHGWFKTSYLVLPGLSTKEAVRNLQDLVDDTGYIRASEGDGTYPGRLRVPGWPKHPNIKRQTLAPAGVNRLADYDANFVRVPRQLILDRSKADTIQKALILFQVGWMVVQCAARKMAGLPLCLLELHTMVHVVCAIVMYIFWFEKPLDLRSAEILQPPSTARYHLSQKEVYLDRGNIPDFDSSWLHKLYIAEVFKYMQDRVSLRILALVLPIIYGGIHLSAWNFEFPTTWEGQMWRISCMVIVFTPLAVFTITRATLGTADLDVWENSPYMMVFAWILTRFLTLLLLLSQLFVLVVRVFIVFEAFYSLRSVPIGVYWTPSWIQMIPHI